jgi:hypothetical protein
MPAAPGSMPVAGKRAIHGCVGIVGFALCVLIDLMRRVDIQVGVDGATHSQLVATSHVEVVVSSFVEWLRRRS